MLSCMMTIEILQEQEAHLPDCLQNILCKAVQFSQGPLCVLKEAFNNQKQNWPRCGLSLLFDKSGSISYVVAKINN